MARKMESMGTIGKYQIIGVTGMPGSGKGEFCNRASQLEIPVRSMGDVVREHFSRTCPDENMKMIGKHANDERERYGKDIWASRLAEKIDGLLSGGSRLVVIDGVRSPLEVDLFKRRWGDSIRILCVHSSPDIRFKRLRSRERGDDPGNRSEFDERDLRELSWGLGDVIARADMMLVNDSDLEDFVKQVNGFLEGLL